MRGTPSRADFVASRRAITIACDNPAHAKPRSDADPRGGTTLASCALGTPATRTSHRDWRQKNVGAKKSEEIRQAINWHIDGHTTADSCTVLARSSPSRPSSGTIGPSGG